MALPNCLCKLKHFTFYFRDLILERAEWDKEKDDSWPILHDLVAVTTMSCLKNEGFKFLKRGAFGWAKHDKNVSLRKFRTINVTCFDGEVQLRAQIHFIDDDELEFYEMKTEEKVAASIHFAPCGGYYLGLPVYLQYDIPRLLNCIYSVINPVREYITQNWQFNRFIYYIKYFPLILTETLFGKYDEQVLDDTNEEGNYTNSHTNQDKLMFLSPEMTEAQVKSKLIIYHYRDNEDINFLFKNYKSINRNDSQINIIHTNRNMSNLMDNNNEMQGEDTTSELMEETLTNNSSSTFSSFHMDGSFNQVKQLKDQNIKNYFSPQMVYACDELLHTDDEDLYDTTKEKCV